MKRYNSVAEEWCRSGKRVAPKGREKRPTHRETGKRFWQFIACGGIFVLLVAIKLLLPGRLEPLSQALEQNMDVQAVFSAVGNIVSRKADTRDALDDVYRAVFAPQAEQITGAPSNLPEDGAALRLLRTYSGQTDRDDPVPELSDLAYILYSDANLPENVSLAQEILGFDYCAPVIGEISSPFGYREHPADGEERFHYGVDLVADSGEKIACFANGTVTAVGESSSYGKYCVVAHDNGYETLYAHCSRITAASGAEVFRGETIAEVGATGMATGPHLHFELQREGKYLNPVYYVAAG